MTEHFPGYSAIWHSDGKRLAGRQPAAVLQAGDAAALASLPAQLADLLKPGQQAVGLLAYGTSGPATVQIFDQAAVHKLPMDQPADLTGHPFALSAPFSSDMEQTTYMKALQQIRDYLRAGDCYQVNFARRFSTRFRGDPLAAWQTLARQHPAPHSSFFRLPNGDCVFGVSPERFVQIRNRRIVSEPIKGSRPRGIDPQQDMALGDSLLGSPKDRAENLMIVDLLRNDLGKVCVAGSVQAAPLFELRKFSNVQHLVSTVSGTLREEVSPLAALLSCFPGGSITGAPKKRAMEIIAELEPVPRGYYCGTQFSLDSEGNLESNILIRTFQTQGDQIYCHGGGGIVIDSDPLQEYQESLFKIEKLMSSL
ncbi:MAG: anthranilate synthase component I family protein [Alcanivoracaceae bacterium]|jgi:para-aminobenzoate synthetase component 1|nr:anthranilate synthase component I family protein [Alcanivoracaceae bacterium]